MLMLVAFYVGNVVKWREGSASDVHHCMVVVYMRDQTAAGTDGAVSRICLVPSSLSEDFSCPLVAIFGLWS